MDSAVAPLRSLASAYADPRRIDALSDHQVAEWAPAFNIKWNSYLQHVCDLRASTPTERQWAFLLLNNVREIMYGGATGGGKSDALLMAALQYVDVPGYQAILFRRSYADLERPGALIPRSKEWLAGTDAHWNGRRWLFPSGAVLDFGYLAKSDDVYRYQSTDYAFVGFDELTQFKLEWYRYMFSRSRKLVGREYPIRFRSGTNPGGNGHEWVKQRFIIEGMQNGRVFVPSRLEDNKYIDRAEYEESLKELDSVTYQQYRFGDWNIARTGIFFNRATFPLLDEDTPLPSGAIRMWDLAATKNQTSAYTAGALLSFRDGKLTIHDMRRIRGDPGEVEALVRRTAEEDGRAVKVWMEQEPGSGGINTMWRYRHAVLAGWTFEEYVPRHDKLTRASPLSALAKHGGVAVVRGRYLSTLFDEFDAFPDGFKDQVDTCSAGLQVLTQKPSYNIRSL